MAIIQNKEQNGLRIGSMQNLYSESQLQENYIRDQIRAYGQDIRYWKLKTPYPEVFKPILDSNNLAIHAYGEGYVQEWEDPVGMIALLKFESDGINLNAYGIIPDSTITMWLDQTDFAISLAKKLSQWREFKVVGQSEFILDFENDQDLIQNRDNILIDFKTDLFDGVLRAVITDRTLDQLLVPQECEEIKSPLPISMPCDILEHGNLKIDTGRVNPLLYKGDHYDPFEDDMVDCYLHLEVTSVQKDRTGAIKIMGGIRGGVIYHDTTVIGKYIDKVKPEVGDLIDVPVPAEDGSLGVYRQKYEIVPIVENGANDAMMNPFLRKYLYEISLRAYVASGQTEPDEQADKKEKQDTLDLVNQAAENAAKKIGLYEDFEDNVYGGFHKVNHRGNASVQRDATKSTINNFDPPSKEEIAKKKLKKSVTALFAFKDQKMVLSLISDPRNNNSFLKLSPLKKSTVLPENFQYIEYLRADDDNLVLVNGIEAYLLASRFKSPELDDATYCIKPIRLKHEVYGQKGGWQDQPFSQMDKDKENELDMNLQDLIGKNTTDPWKSASENRLTFPWSNTYLYCDYERVEGTEDVPAMEVWTCYAVLDGDPEKTPLPICSFIKKPRN